jgi:hypothetical protein
MKDKTRGPIWAFQQRFEFKSQASLDEVVKAVAHLSESTQSSVRYPLSMSSLDDSHSFHYSIEQHQSRRGWEREAVSEGHIWRDGTGTVTVQGTAQIDSSVYITATSIIVMCIIVDLLTIHSLSVCFVFSLIFGVVVLRNACSERNHLIERIFEAVADVSRQAFKVSSETAHLASRDSDIRDVLPSANRSIDPDSIWNDALSEYEMK